MLRCLLTSFILLCLLTLSASAQNVQTLESIEEIRAMSPEQAARNLPVAVEMTVTFRHPSHQSLIGSDGREGIYVELPPGMGEKVNVGSRVKVEGITKPGGFLPIISCRNLIDLGVREPIPPRPIDADELFSPSLDCQWVEIAARITGVEGHDTALVLVAEISGWTVRLLLPPGEESLERAAQLMQRPVTLRGVVGSVFNSQRQLTARHFFVPGFDQIIPTETALPQVEPRLFAVNELLRSDSTSQTRVRVRGIVTHVAEDGLYMRGDGGSVFVHTIFTEASPGTRIEAEGFAAVAPFRPTLRATRVTVLSRAIPPQPQVLDLTGRELSSQQAELVTVDAVVQVQREGQSGVLQCRSGDWFFEVLLPTQSAPIPQVDPNTGVRITGICELTTTRSLPFSESVDGFRLTLRSPDDLVILSRPSWWTARRTLWALGIMGAAALVILAWAALLRQRVAEQTTMISMQIERSAVKDERQRIARELHDTIEQELAGLSIQLRNARQRLVNAPDQAGESLALAEKMLKHCREEARTSIQDLRHAALELRGLDGALEDILTPLVAESGSLFSYQVKGRPYKLAGPSELHLLRIAHEAVANASRHAKARLIQVILDFTADTVTLEVKDDGNGFVPSETPPRGHFGLLGMKERANKLRGRLTIASIQGSGTVVKVTVPAEVAMRPTKIS